VLAILAAIAAGALWGWIAGWLKAATGAHEVISTIMLNWIAVWVGRWLFGLGGPLQSDTQRSFPVSNDIAPGASCRCSGAIRSLQGLHVGSSSRSPRCSSSGCCSTARRRLRGARRRLQPGRRRVRRHHAGRNYVKVMLICGAFAGLAGAIDVLGWQFRIATNDVQRPQVGFLGIAVALLGRNTRVGTLLARCCSARC
jgi:simple sugar transport system permease protein